MKPSYSEILRKGVPLQKQNPSIAEPHNYPVDTGLTNTVH
jgi:hypothetical protein